LDSAKRLAAMLSPKSAAFHVDGLLVQWAHGLHSRAASRERDNDMATQTGTDRPNNNRGFASMDLSKQREIARRGGTAAHAQGRAHEFTSDEARDAGRKGGKAVSADREHMAAIGRAGGRARGRNRALRAANNDGGSSRSPAE
jgi:general stress protein YciG